MPSRRTIVRWGGLAAMMAGVLYVLGTLSTAFDFPLAYVLARPHLSAGWDTATRLLVLGGVAGLHTHQADARGYGRLGVTGFLLAFVGGLLALVLGSVLFSGASPEGSPPIAVLVVTGTLDFAAEVGMLLLGVATLRAAALSWRALPLAIFVLGVRDGRVAGKRGRWASILPISLNLSESCCTVYFARVVPGRCARKRRP